MLERGGPLLLVLDDLWTGHQLTELLGIGTRLPSGSQLLLTSRRRDVLASHNPTPMKLLSDASATTLLAWHACHSASLPAHLGEVAEQALNMCSGLPLAIKVLGGVLRSSAASESAATEREWQVRHVAVHRVWHVRVLCGSANHSVPT